MLVQSMERHRQCLQASLRALVAASTLTQARQLIDKTLQNLGATETAEQGILFIEVCAKTLRFFSGLVFFSQKASSKCQVGSCSVFEWVAYDYRRPLCLIDMYLPLQLHFTFSSLIVIHTV